MGSRARSVLADKGGRGEKAEPCPPGDRAAPKHDGLEKPPPACQGSSSQTQKGRLSTARTCCPVVMAAISGASPPMARAIT